MNQAAFTTLLHDFKTQNASDGGIVTPNRLTALTALAIAYASPLPDNGRYGSGDAFNAVANDAVNSFVDAMNAQLYIDMDKTIELAKGLYLNRYDMVYSPALALEALAPITILSAIFDGELNASTVDAKATVLLWGERFSAVAVEFIKTFNQE
jgi:hypothetical protein